MTLYSDLKIFHFPQKIDNLGHDMPVTAPVHIRLKPTNKCNHRCRYCAYRSSDLQLGKDMRIADTIPQGKMFEICKDIVAMGVKAVTFSGGGEPLMYPYLLEGARILKEGGPPCLSDQRCAAAGRRCKVFFAECRLDTYLNGRLG